MKKFFMLEDNVPLTSIRKLLLVMKLTLLFVFVGVLQLYASDTYSQNARISLNLQNAKFEDVFSAIEKQSEFEFFYNNNQIDASQLVSVNVDGMKISDLLNRLFSDKGLAYKVVGNRIILVKQNSFESELLGAIDNSAQQVSVTGVVKDAATGEPIPGVNVLVEGTTIGVVTDIDGKFSLNVPSASSVLAVSYIGYVTQKVSVGNQTNLAINLVSDVTSLEEVVVVGYGTVKKRDLTGSVGSIKSDDISKTASSNAMQSLQARMPGIDINQADGQAGSKLNINLRGSRSLLASNDPLILVDGVEYGSTLDLNPSDIESMDVLKDASSTAIYGTKGANGVIIITTKRGKAGKSMVNFNAFMSSNRPTNVPKVAYGTVEVQRLIDKANYASDFANYTKTGEWGTSALTPEDILTLTLDDGTPEYSIYQDGSYTDWADLLLQNGLTQNYELSVSGGNEKTTYNLSLGYMNEEGLMKRDMLSRYNGKINIDHKISNKFKAGGSILYTYKDQDARTGNLFGRSLNMTTITHPYNSDGTIYKTPNPRYAAHSNPLLDEAKGVYQDNTLSSRFFGNTYLEVTPFKNLVYKSMFALDRTNDRLGDYQDYESVSRFQAPSTSYISNESKYRNKYTWENTLNYNIDLGKHSITALLGQSMTESVYEQSKISGEAGKNHYYENAFYDVKKIPSPVVESAYTQSSMLSFFGRLNYKFNEKYLLTASLRADGSSTLAKGNKWGYFPSVAAAWRLNEESFMDGTKSWLTNLKLRASWGISGNAAVDPYSTLAALSKQNVYYYFNGGDVIGKVANTMENPNLKWETTSAYNYGIDFGILDNRVSGSVDYFISKTTDLLYFKTYPASSVYPTLIDNVGETEGHGIEVALNTLILKANDFSWDVNWSYTSFKDKVSKLTEGIEKYVNGNDALIVGEPVKAFYNFEADGCWGIGEFATYKAEWEANHPGATTNFIAGYGDPGTIKIIDKNDDGQLGDEDKIIYDRTPKHIIGMNNTFSYKDLSLSVQVYARLGGYIKYDYNSQLTYETSNWADLDYWTPTNTGAKFPSPGAVSSPHSNYGSSLLYEKADYVKIKDITLSYNLPKNIIGKIGLGQLKVYGSLKNYFTFSGIDNYDPERGGAISFPLAKQMVFGLNLQF
jgi:TonB-linked SusC/RagA family outer membrane protein